MNLKTSRLLLSALGFIALSAYAQTPAAAPAPAEPTTGSWVLTPSFVSQYMFRGARLGGPSFEPSLEYDYGAFVVGVWSNFPLADKVVGQSDPEFDFYGSYTMDVIKDVTFVPGFTAYTYPNAKKANGFYKGTFEPSVALNYTIGDLKLTPKLYYDVILKGPTLELTAAYVVPLKDLGTELDFTGTYGTFKWDEAAVDASPAIKNWGDYYLIGVAAPFQVTKNSKFTAGFAYTKGSNNYFKQGTDHKAVNTAAVGRGVITLSYAITF